MGLALRPFGAEGPLRWRWRLRDEGGRVLADRGDGLLDGLDPVDTAIAGEILRRLASDG